MKKLSLIIAAFTILASLSQAQILVYRMLTVENVFDSTDVCPVKEPKVAFGFIALEVDVDEIASLECGESASALDAVLLKYGRSGQCRFYCTEYPLVEINQMGNDKLCAVIEISEDQIFSDSEVLSETTDSNDPNEPVDTYDSSGQCFTCFIDAYDANDLIDIGGGIQAAVPRLFRGSCLYNGTRFRGTGRCVLQLSLTRTRLANDVLDTPQTAIDRIINRILFRYRDIGSCCDPDETCF